MEKAVASNAVDSKAVASNTVDSKAVASNAVPVTDDAAGASAATAGRGQIPPEWDDPYEEVPYICPPNPYDTSIADPWPEVDSSDVGSDDEDKHTKARQVLRRLQMGQYDSYFANNVYKCPFYRRRLGGTDFNCLVTHAENISSCHPNAYRAKHKTLGIHLRNIQ